MPTEAQVGQELTPLVIESVSAERMKTVAALLNDSNPIHFDVESVKALGMGDRVVNQGPNNMAYLVTMLGDWAGGPGHVRGLRVRFLGNVFAGDRLTARATVTGVRENFSIRSRQSVVLPVPGCPVTSMKPSRLLMPYRSWPSASRYCWE